MRGLPILLMVSCFCLANVVCSSDEVFPGPKVNVATVGGVPTFMVNNTPFMSPCFETYAPKEDFFEQFARAGTKLYSYNINAGGHPYENIEVWVDPDTWDFGWIDERAEEVLKADPDALLIPRIYLGLPRWWCETNPEELQVLDHGGTLYRDPNPNTSVPKGRPFPCIASEKWRADLKLSLTKTLQHIHSSSYADRIFGYLIAGLDTEEWYHWSSGSNQLSGYSKPMEKAFRKWLTNRYQTDENLQRAWHNPTICLASATVPSREERWDKSRTFRDPVKEMNVIDFYSFYNQLVPETIELGAKVIKEFTLGTKVVGAFYGFMYAFRGDPEYGHNALEYYNNSPWLDFAFVTASYLQRDFAVGGTFQRGPGRSILLNNKVYYHDNDSMSFVSEDLFRNLNWAQETIDECLFYHAEITDAAQQSRWIYQRDTGFALANGFYTSFFDLHGGHFNHPDLMDEIKRLNRIAEQSVDYDRSSCAEILVISDERSCNYATIQSDMLGELLKPVQTALMQMGAPQDHILLCDLAKLDVTPYKMVVFLNTFNLTDKDRSMIRDKLMCQGRHLVWCYAPGYFNEDQCSPELMKTLTGIRIFPADSQEMVAPKIALRGVNSSSSEYLAGIHQAGVKQLGNDLKCCQLMYVDDPLAEPLGYLPGTRWPTLAIKRQQDWTSIYTISSTLPAAVWREMARLAGVHIYNEEDDTFYLNQSYLCLHARTAGPRTVQFPAPCHLYNLLDDTWLSHESLSYHCNLERGETLLLRLDRTP